MSSTLITVGWAGAILCILLWLLVINLVYCYYRLLPYEEIIQNRNPGIILLMGYLAIAYMTFAPIVILIIFGAITDSSGLLSGSSFVYSLFTILSMPIIYLSIWRGFKIYFDIKFHQALQDAQWRMYIDPTETNWFLKNKTKWADGKRLAIILSIIYLLYSFLGISRAWFIAGEVDDICRYILALHTLTVCVFGFILYCKFPVFDDIWLVRKEIQLSSLSVSLIALSYILAAAIFKIQINSPYYIILLYMAIAVTIFPIFASMFWVFVQFQLPWNIFILPQHIDAFKHRQHLLNSSFSQAEDAKNIRLHQILQDDNGFNLFARHLTKEFSMENLLFFIETQQWIKNIVALHPDRDYAAGIDAKYQFTRFCDITFPDNAPKSKLVEAPAMNVSGVIVNMDGTIASSKEEKENVVSSPKQVHDTQQTDSEKVYFSAVKIFKKYVINQAYFCINISGEHRKKLYELFGWQDNNQLMNTSMVHHLQSQNMDDVTKLVHIFDAPRLEVYKLMLNGFKRFKLSEEFAKHENEFYHNK